MEHDGDMNIMNASITLHLHENIMNRISRYT
jgi:hypothetical protein